MVAQGESPIALIRPGPAEAVYRMDAVWHQVGEAIRACLGGDRGLGMRVVGLAFDATPGLVLRCAAGLPLAGGGDVFAAGDRRAGEEAGAIAALGGPVAEGHLARLLWLKRRAPETWARLNSVRDLADELVLRATGNDRHSLATIAARWPFRAGADDPWQHGLLAAIGLDDVWGLGALAGDPVPLGQAQGKLVDAVASYLGLPPGIPVSPGLLDAQAGLLGTIGRRPRRAAGQVTLVAGRSAPLVLLAAGGRVVPGMAGPWPDAILPGLSLYQGGADWSGEALDRVLEAGLGIADGAAHGSVAAEILALLEREGPGFAAMCHVLPRDDGGLAMGAATGVGVGRGRRGLLEAYYAVARGLALAAGEAVAGLRAQGLPVSRVALAGGQARNALMERLYRDTLGCDLVVTRHPEPVLLGTAMMAAVAAGVHPDMAAAIEVMAPAQARLAPDPFWRRAHAAADEIRRGLVLAQAAAERGAGALAGMGRSGTR